MKGKVVEDGSINTLVKVEKPLCMPTRPHKLSSCNLGTCRHVNIVPVLTKILCYLMSY